MEKVTLAYIILGVVILAAVGALGYLWFNSHERAYVRRQRRERTTHDAAMAAKEAGPETVESLIAR